MRILCIKFNKQIRKNINQQLHKSHFFVHSTSYLKEIVVSYV